MHIGQFLELYGSVSCFTQQGLEKLNDLTTKYFQHSTNHRERESLLQILQKQNCLEMLEEYQRTKQFQKCSVCKVPGHNKRTCTSANATVQNEFSSEQEPDCESEQEAENSDM